MIGLPKGTLCDWRVALLAAATVTTLPDSAAEPPPLSADAARARMATARGPLILDDVVTLDAAAAAVLATHTSGIAIDKVTTLRAPSAAMLALHGRQKPEPPDDDPTPLLKKLRVLLAAEVIDGAAARDLIDRFAPPTPGDRRIAWLSLAGLQELEPDVALTLAVHAGPLALDGLKNLSVESARSLALHTGELSLAGLETLPTEVGRALAEHRGPVAIPDALLRSAVLRPAVVLGNAAAAHGDARRSPEPIVNGRTPPPVDPAGEQPSR